MHQFELVIFDCDGVLVDSERITNTVFAQMLNELGLNLTLEDMFNKFVGNSMTTCLEMIQGMLGKSIPKTFVGEYKVRTKKALESELQAVEGIKDALDRLNLPYCVASSGDREKMQTTLGITNLLSYFEDKLFSVTEVANGKPHPDIFLYAAEKMGFKPEKCVVVEDTPIGVKGGVAAGMTVFGYAKLMKPEKLTAAGAHIIFDEMKLLPELVENN
ncbi:HAD family hydrolase [Mastigocoleus sp. MO_188.B34]|uniref:HAD family hydrolase n=1 Tax=Mastigocoleus sp. MO_188.B34 TaxID=3036635 RepID=UPI002603883A|nr:HAD family hydrolase [Mastigocoleus sp. MO_188.B34]MDJ0693366.1 HAD family hydrolase [Mastigocoleus sp. MO_188.B34]